MKRIFLIVVSLFVSIVSYSYDILLTVNQIDNSTWDISVELANNNENFTAFQMDIELAGANSGINQFNKGSLLSQHILTTGTPDNHYRIIAHNNDNNAFPAKEGSILSFRVNGQFECLTVKNIQFAKLNAVVLPASDRTFIPSEEKSSINIVTEDIFSQNKFDVYNINGIKVNVGKKGIYILNNKKILLK